MKRLAVALLLAGAWIPAQSHNATFSCGPKVDQQTCQTTSQQFVTFTAVTRVGGLRQITILDPDSYRKEDGQALSRNPMDTYLQNGGDYQGQILFESEAGSVCPTTVFFSTAIIDDNKEFVLDDKGQPKLDSKGQVVTRSVPPTAQTRFLNTFRLEAFIDGYTRACWSAVGKVVGMEASEKGRNAPK